MCGDRGSGGVVHGKERSRLRQINIVLDLYSGEVCLILFCCLCFGRGRKDRMRQCFIGMCAFSFGMAMGDIPNWAFEGLHKPWYPAALWCGTLVFWLCSSLLLLSFTGYLIRYLASKVTVHKYFKRMAAALCVLHMAGILLSVRNGMFFTITPENHYRRGDWFWLSQALPFSIYAVDIAIFAAYRKSLSRMDIMLSQIQPHFLYNALTAIRCLCDRDPRQAKKAIRDFSIFLRTNMDSLGSKAPVPFDQELSHTEHYLALERQRFQERLQVVYEIGPRDFCIPPLTLQPMVENAVRHGILKQERGGTVITITIPKEETANELSRRGR